MAIRQVVGLFGVDLSHSRPRGLAGLLMKLPVLWSGLISFIHVLDEIAHGLIAAASGVHTDVRYHPVCFIGPEKPRRGEVNEVYIHLLEGKNAQTTSMARDVLSWAHSIWWLTLQRTICIVVFWRGVLVAVAFVLA